jgi:hypothetical protein
MAPMPAMNPTSNRTCGLCVPGMTETTAPNQPSCSAISMPDAGTPPDAG